MRDSEDFAGRGRRGDTGWGGGLSPLANIEDYGAGIGRGTPENRGRAIPEPIWPSRRGLARSRFSELGPAR